MIYLHAHIAQVFIFIAYKNYYNYVPHSSFDTETLLQTQQNTD